MGWLAGWAKRIKITIDHNDVDASLSHFPVLLYLSSSSGITGVDVTPVFDEVGANSKKIAVTKADGTTQLYVEIEKWDSVNEKAWLWVSRSGWSISNTVDTDIYIYYDNTKADNTTYVGDIGLRTEVWDDNFLVVYHMRDYDASTVKNSKADSKHMGKKGANEPTETTGKINSAQDFDGTDDYMEASGYPTSFSALTIEAWIKPDALPSNDEQYLVYLPYSDNTRWIRFRTYDNDISFMIWTGAWAERTVDGLSVGTHDYVAGVYTGSVIRAYRNLTVSSDLSASLIGSGNSYMGVGFGSIPHSGAYGKPFNGIIDEIRISNTARSSAWIKGSYESGRDHFVTYGSEETPPVKGKPASIIPIMRVMDFLQIKLFSSRFSKFKPRLVA